MAVLKQWISKVGIRRGARAFTIAPALIRSGDAVVNFFPRTLTYVVDEQTTRARLKRESERIAQAQRPNFLASSRSVEEWIVGRDRAVRIDAQNLSQEIGERLRVGAVGVLADRDIQLAVRAKVDRAAV